MKSFNNVGLVITVGELLKTDTELIVMKLKEFIDGVGYKKRRGEDIGFNQVDAWRIEIKFLKEQFSISSIKRDTYVLLEYMLPEENTERPDAVLLFEKDVYSLEFKTIGKHIKDDYATQFIDYRVCLQNYHKVCIDKGLTVHSNLILCSCKTDNIIWNPGVKDKVVSDDIDAVIGYDKFQELVSSMPIGFPMTYEDVENWIKSKRGRSQKIWNQGRAICRELKKTGTSGIYSRIKTIPFSDLRATQDKINEIIKRDEKQIVFVSGVPGAGKTLIGLITLFGCIGDKLDARYYTGNGALKDVLAFQTGSKEITLLPEFRRDYVVKQKTCDEQVLIFDEAQRFWDGQTNKLNQTDAQGILNVCYSRNVTIVCLIGTGQKPMSGEAGIEAWVDALKLNRSWKVYAPKIHENEFSGVNAVFYDDLYLDVAKRQHFVDLSKWVEAVIDCDIEMAKKELGIINTERDKEKFGLVVTRSLKRLYRKDQSGKCVLEKLKDNRGEDYLFGILCSSKNDMDQINRLSEGVIKQGNTYILNSKAHEWYGGDCCDTDNIKVATETFCQGLEVDLPIVFFGGDYLIKKEKGKYVRRIKPSKNAQQRYGDSIDEIMVDTYRIILTRATEEMIIVIPGGPEYNDTYNFFVEMGVREYK